MRSFLMLLAVGVGTLAVACDVVMPAVELRVRVLDGDGVPLPRTQVGAFFPHFYGAGAPVKGKNERVLTDTDGRATLSGRASENVGGGAQREGYYRTQFEEVDFIRLREEGKPLKAEREIVLKKIMNPIALVARPFPDLIIPRENDACGFDLEVGDWVAPRGKGKNVDIFFDIVGGYPSHNEFDAALEITFPNKGDGLVYFEGKQNVGSELISDYHAPKSGYVPKLKLAKRAEAGQTTSQWLDESKPGSNYYFRVRTVLDKKGKFVSAHYGKIYGRFEFGRYIKAECLFLKSGIYYFNPTVNDRNVEFDRSRNLAADVTASDRVTLP